MEADKMGFCDLCGCHGDYYDRMIELKQTELKHHSSDTLIFVCDGCFDRLKKYDKCEVAFNTFHFSKQVNEDKYNHPATPPNESLELGETIQ